jgi:hypothetical protein
LLFLICCSKHNRTPYTQDSFGRFFGFFWVILMLEG